MDGARLGKMLQALGTVSSTGKELGSCFLSMGKEVVGYANSPTNDMALKLTMPGNEGHEGEPIVVCIDTEKASRVVEKMANVSVRVDTDKMAVVFRDGRIKVGARIVNPDEKNVRPENMERALGKIRAACDSKILTSREEVIQALDLASSYGVNAKADVVFKIDKDHVIVSGADELSDIEFTFKAESPNGGSAMFGVGVLQTAVSVLKKIEAGDITAHCGDDAPLVFEAPGVNYAVLNVIEKSE